MVAGGPPAGTVRVVAPRPVAVTPRGLLTLPDSTVADTGRTSLLRGCSRKDCQPAPPRSAWAGRAAGAARSAVMVAASSRARLVERHRCLTVDASPFILSPESLAEHESRC